MKTPKKSTVNKLIERFDNELKSLLLKDLQAVRTQNLINAINGGLNNQLAA